MVGKVVVPIAILLLQFAVLFTFGGVVLGLRIRGSVVALGLVAAAFALALVALGLVLIAFCRSILQLNSISNLTAMAFAGLGGAMAPLSAEPGWAQALAPITPTYWAMRGFRSVIVEPGGLSDVALPVGLLVATATAMFAVAATRFRLEETKMSWG
jgi:ABC-2 type transport system permease protein